MIFLKAIFTLCKREEPFKEFSRCFSIQKTRQRPLRFYIQKAGHFMLQDFTWKFRTSHLYTKSVTICVRWLIISKNIDTSQKARQFALRLYIQKSWHFVLRDFSLNFWNWRRSGDICIRKKQRTLRYVFLTKTVTFCVSFFYYKTMHFAFRAYTVLLIEMPHFQYILLLHHYRSDLALISDFDSLVIGLSKSEKWANNNNKNKWLGRRGHCMGRFCTI